MRKTKIVCTLGPASASEETMEKMLKNGLNIARLNFSHGTHESHGEMIDRFRRVRDRLGLPAAVMLDTKGPEIRLRKFKNGGVTLADGAKFVLTSDEIEGTAERVTVSYDLLPKKLKAGDRILIDDGKIALRVDSTDERNIFCTVVNGGKVSDRKGINIPSVALGMPYLSETDKSDLLFGIEKDVDFIAASFVRSKADVELLRSFLVENGGEHIKIIAKIENLEGVRNFEEILDASNGIMVARGDMGVEIEFERLPGLQKTFIRSCYRAGKMVITATQMLESMVSNLRPTRAETSDVANAVFDGTSAVMLSGESAMGCDPANVVAVMAKIVEKAEADAFAMQAYKNLRFENDITDITNAISDATCTTARDLHATAIIVVTKSGTTARRVSKFRPHEPIIAATPDVKTFHQLSLSWGVYPVMSKNQTETDMLFLNAVDAAKTTGIPKDGDITVITAGVPLGISGKTNILKVHVVGEDPML